MYPRMPCLRGVEADEVHRIGVLLPVVDLDDLREGRVGCGLVAGWLVGCGLVAGWLRVGCGLVAGWGGGGGGSYKIY